ncbi:hypothetical protein Q4Q35_01250 [Flavivirga aquimarina]|uniref:DUF4157 domain-containing protein n=1 Tax=Flavivirga aquimarina TaxID=2027862 RepID=A0ABT8W5N3_9FLAO|nr:hypothetical protein [Flavivirga aquimarina]MDO5968423.1 hypothetical protein [Flavivirga aquimarina]
MILISKHLVPKGYNSLTIFPFVFLKSQHLKSHIVLINHEKIHLKQQLEMLLIPFYFVYAIEFLFRLFQYKKWDLAYRNISFEREAYANESNLDYLNQRSLFSFFKYLRTHDI